MSFDRAPITTATAPHFIGSWQLSDHALCRDIIAFFEDRRADHHAGATGSGVDTAAKQSMDLTIRPRDLDRADHEPLSRYMSALKAMYLDYLAQWDFLAKICPTVHIGNFNIQKYETGGHFRQVHSERTSLATLHRLFAFMTYLNDVDAGGETEFAHFDLAIRPRAGLTLIWPSEWTHAHAARPVEAGCKYIVTGWMHFPDS